MSILELRHIRKSFDGQGVLEDISLSVTAGSVTAIIGPSGSGKSTLLRCATLLETADGGDIVYEGKFAAKDGIYCERLWRREPSCTPSAGISVLYFKAITCSRTSRF